MGFAPTWLRQVSPPPLLRMTTLTTGRFCLHLQVAGHIVAAPQYRSHRLLLLMTSRSRGLQVLQGNVNTYIAELREVDPPIIARRIRFVPYSVHPKPACMRVELYGCAWTGKD